MSHQKRQIAANHAADKCYQILVKFFIFNAFMVFELCILILTTLPVCYTIRLFFL